MADEIIRTIYKLEIDDSGYIRGVESLSSSTNKFTEIQAAANRALQILENALAEQSKAFQKAKQDLESYTGADQKYKDQLTKSFKQAEADNQKLIGLVGQARKEYEAASKAAQDFAATSQRAANLQPPGGSRIPTQPPPGIAAGLNAQIFNTVNLQEFGELAVITANTKQEFDELRDSIQLAEQRLKQLDEGSEEFKALVPLIEQANKALREYDQAAEGASEATGSLRSQIRAGREELVKMEQAGKANSKEYFELEKRVAKLTDAYGDQQQRIRILASDTKLLDFGKGAITAATSAFQAYTAVSILAGDQSEELQKKTMQLFAAMQLLQSLEQLSNLTRREGVLATLAQAGAQSVYTTVVGASTGALRAFRIALAATGVGAVIAGIAFLVIELNKVTEASKQAAKEQAALVEIGAEAARSFAAEVTHLQLIKNELNDLNNPQKERIKLAKEYNKTADEGNKIDLKQIDNIKLINAAIDTQIAKIKERGLARAAETVIAQRAEEVFRLQAEIAARSPVLVDRDAAGRTQRLRNEQKALEDRANSLIANRAKILGIKPPSTDELLALSGLSDEQINAGAANSKKLQVLQDATIRNQLRNIDQQRTAIQIANTNIPRELRKLFEDLGAAEAELRIATNVGVKFITPDSLIPRPGSKEEKDIENVFAQRLRDLQAKLAEVTAKSFESEGTIREQFRLSLEKEIGSLNQLVKEKKLTAAQAEILIELTTRINEVQLTEALDQFNKKVTDARNKLNEDIRQLQQQNTEDQINLLQDEFERRRQLIDFNEQQQLAQVQENTADRLAALEEQRDLVGEQAYQDAKNDIVQAGEDAQTNIIIEAAQQRQQLAQDSFKKSLDFFQNAINEIDLIDDQDSAREIRALSDKFLKQQITFQEFQKQLERIERDYAAKKRNRDLLIERGELDALNFKLTQIEDKTSAHYKELLRLRDEQAAKVADLEKQDAIKDATDKNTDTNTGKVETLNDYVQAVGQLADSVIQFWQAANQAESEALDRSIALQERRVDAAQRIAERGNAQYLAAEEDRLKELEIARENAARRQLAVDAALQASQLLVGITGAISKIATPGIGIAEVIGSIAVIVGALATGYGLIKSLQGNQPRLFKGTKYLERDGHPAGRDTIPVMANEGEAWIPTETNKKYYPAVSAIYDQTIPPEVINNFVSNYNNGKTINENNTISNKSVNESIKNYYNSKIANENIKTVNEFVSNAHTIKQIPQINYERVKEAAELKISHDGKMAVILNEHSALLRENNDLQKAILRKRIKVEQTIDRNGVAAMVTEFIEQQEINKHI